MEEGRRDATTNLGPVVYGSRLPLHIPQFRQFKEQFFQSQTCTEQGRSTFGDSVKQGIIHYHATPAQHVATAAPSAAAGTAGVLKHRGIRANMKLHQEHGPYRGPVSIMQRSQGCLSYPQTSVIASVRCIDTKLACTNNHTLRRIGRS